MTTTLTVSAVAAPFGRDLEESFNRIAVLLARARARGAGLVVLPEAALGGYLANLDGHGDVSLPPALDLDGPEVRRLARLAGDLVVTAGLCEADGGRRFNTAVAVTGDGVLGAHRKVHQPLGECASYDAGDGFAAFDTPVGRLGMMICYDKAFPEAGRALAVDGAEIVCCMSAWPAARTDPAPVLADDRWTHRFDLCDRAGALANQVLWVSANQSGSFGSMRFVASAKVVGPGGDVLATTGTREGVATATLDLDAVLGAARGGMFHLRDRRPQAYPLALGA
jgi:N-carbamoylputrescine amidase